MLCTSPDPWWQAAPHPSRTTARPGGVGPCALGPPRASDALEVAGQLPVGDHPVGARPLLAGRVDQVVVDVGPEGLGGHLARCQVVDGFGQVGGYPGDVGRVVGVARRRPVPARARARCPTARRRWWRPAPGRGSRRPRVSGSPPAEPVPSPTDPEPAGAVVLAPHHGGGRPRVGNVAPVGVDVGGEAPRQLVGRRRAGRPRTAGPRSERPEPASSPSDGAISGARVDASHRLAWMWQDEPALRPSTTWP